MHPIGKDVMITKLCLFIMILLSFIVGGCSSPKSNHASSLNIAIYDDPASLSPDQAKRALDLSIAKLLFEGLTRENPTTHTQIELALAHHYTVSKDERTYTFFLRNHACWSDGTPITSDDIITAWEHARHNSPYHLLFEGMHFSAQSPQEVVLSLNQPNPDLLRLLTSPAFSIFNPHNPHIYTGPFRVVTYNPGHCLLLKKNPYYYDHDKVHLPAIHLLVIPDIHTASLLFNRGQIHWLGQPWHQGLPKEIYENSPHKYTCYPLEGFFFLTINTKDPILAQMHTRYRLASAINREEIIAYALQNNPQPAYSLKRDAPPTHYKKPQIIAPVEKITLSYPSDIIKCQRIAEILKEQCKAVGIDLCLEGLEYNVFVNKRQMYDFSIATATKFSPYPGAHGLPQEEKAIHNLEIIPIYHLSYDYLTRVDIHNILYNASGAVDLKYATFK